MSSEACHQDEWGLGETSDAIYQLAVLKDKAGHFPLQRSEATSCHEPGLQAVGKVETPGSFPCCAPLGKCLSSLLKQKLKEKESHHKNHLRARKMAPQVKKCLLRSVKPQVESMEPTLKQTDKPECGSAHQQSQHSKGKNGGRDSGELPWRLQAS